MHVSANIIRFPEHPVAPTGASAPVSQPAAEIIEFAPERPDDRGQSEAQHHGQFFAAHRIVSRVADQLDAIGAL